MELLSRVPGNARERVTQRALLLDVRTSAEFGDRHMPGAVNIPLQELGARLSELGPKQRSIVVYCRSGARSAAASQLMRAAGYDVLDIGGMGNW